MGLLLILATAAVQAAPSTAPPPVHEPSPIEVVGKQDPAEKKVCRTERGLGSRVVKRVCKSAAQQQSDDREARARLRMGSQGANAPEAFKRPRGE